MFDEKERRALYIRALNQYAMQPDSQQSKSLVKVALKDLTAHSESKNTFAAVLCAALTSYLRSLKSIEHLMLSDPLFLGFDGSNPLLVALNKEIDFTLEIKGQLCHEGIPKRSHTRVDW